MDEGEYLVLEVNKEKAWIFNWNTEKNILYIILTKLSLGKWELLTLYRPIQIVFFSNLIEI